MKRQEMGLLFSPATSRGRSGGLRPATVRRWFNLATLVLLFPVLIGGLWGYLGAHPPRLVRPKSENPGNWGVDYQEVSLRTADGLQLAAWFTPGKNGAVILAGHGYANSRLPEVHALFGQNGYGVLSWDFRAHGRSEGSTCTVGYSESMDVEAALDFALAQPNTRWVGLWGGSMGGVAGLRAAVARPEIRALVLDSVPTTLDSCVLTNVPLAVLRPFYRMAAEREAGIAIKVVRPVDDVGQMAPRPLLIVHGIEDSTVLVGAAEKLYQAAGEPKELWLLPGVGHGGYFQADPEAFEQRVVAFFDAALLH